ncbi:MAG: hypothetical protein ACREPM_24860 [Gemmatimonadaceae bacterium]
MSAAVVRVHGTAPLPPVVFPAQALAPHMQRNDLRHEQDCADIFAQANGWAQSEHAPTAFAGLDMKTLSPLIDHPQFFRAPGSSCVVAILSHDYNPARDFSALGARVVVDRLPQSWYRRGVPAGEAEATAAYLLRPTPGLTAFRDPAIATALTRLVSRDTLCDHGATLTPSRRAVGRGRQHGKQEGASIEQT